MNAKHQFKYTYNEVDIEEYCPHEITFEMPGTATLDQLLYNFECYLKASGFVFDGKLEIVEEEQKCCSGYCEANEEEDSLRKWNEDLRELEKRIKDQRAEELNELDEYWEELSDEQREETLSKVLKKCGLEQQITITSEEYEKESQKAHEKELKKNKWVHGMCNPPSPDWKKEYVEDCKPTSKKYSSVKEMMNDLKMKDDLS